MSSPQQGPFRGPRPATRPGGTPRQRKAARQRSSSRTTGLPAARFFQSNCQPGPMTAVTSAPYRSPTRRPRRDGPISSEHCRIEPYLDQDGCASLAAPAFPALRSALEGPLARPRRLVPHSPNLSTKTLPRLTLGRFPRSTFSQSRPPGQGRASRVATRSAFRRPWTRRAARRGEAAMRPTAGFWKSSAFPKMWKQHGAARRTDSSPAMCRTVLAT